MSILYTVSEECSDGKTYHYHSNADTGLVVLIRARPDYQKESKIENLSITDMAN